MPAFASVARLIDEAREAHAFPACTIEVGRGRGVLWQWATGRLTYDASAPETTLDTIFDLASLTKVIATTPITMQLVASRRVLLNSPVSSFVVEWSGEDRRAASLLDLLEHCAGLPAWHDVYHHAATGRDAQRVIAALPLEYPLRSRSVYSDLGFILLGTILESAAEQPLDVQFESLGVEGIRFGPLPDRQARIAPTTDDRVWRKRLLVGEVEDENAAALGGVAGHAGLFGTAPAVGEFARTVLQTLREPTRIGSPWLLRRFLTPSRVPGSSRALGWDLMRPTSSCGRRLSRAAFGHTGFTGVSLWIDPVKDLYVVLLTNRVHPARPSDPDDGLARLRPAVHDAVMAVLED